MTPGNRRGALLLSAAALVFTGEVTVVRLLGDTAGNAQIVFARASVQCVAVLVWVLWRDPALVRTARPALHVLRGLTSLLCWWLYYRSFRSLDLALATTLTFTTSLFVVALAPLVLGERVGAARWVATLIGFAGVAVASGVDGTTAATTATATVDPGILYGLGAAGAAAALVFQNRILSRTEPTPTIMLWIGVVTTLGTLPVLAAGWQPLEARAVLLLGVAGLLGTGGMALTIEAYRVGEVSALAPFPYLRIVFAMAAGVAVFAEPLSPRTLAGAAIVTACALAAARIGEGRRGRSGAR